MNVYYFNLFYTNTPYVDTVWVYLPIGVLGVKEKLLIDKICTVYSFNQDLNETRCTFSILNWFISILFFYYDVREKTFYINMLAYAIYY